MALEAPATVHQPDTIAKPDRRRHSHRILTGSGALAVVSAAVALAGCGSKVKASTSETRGGSATSGPVNQQSPGTSTVRVGNNSNVVHTREYGPLYEEIADNHNGTQLFGSDRGTAVPDGTPGEIGYGTHVLVKCYDPNRNKRGYGSINDFYLIMSGVNGRMKDLHDTFAPADTFSNDGQMGDNSVTIDPNVPKC